MTLWSKLLALVLLALWGWSGVAAAAPDDAAFDRLLGRYVVESPDGVNRVNYAAWKASAADTTALKAYIGSIEKTAISKLPRDAQFAAWANLYNAVTVKVILDNYPVKSIRDIKSGLTLDPAALAGGPWWNKYVKVEGRELTLNNIEHDILRKNFADPRVHYAVNCASYGCPSLPRKAWRAATLDADLDAAARAYVNHARGVTVAADGLRVSSIYKWFKQDFGGTDASLLAHFRRYAEGPTAAALKKDPAILGDTYDWALNEVERAQ